jgi:bacterioferritin
MADEVISREKLVELLNEDLSREYQAIIAYVVYSQVLKGAEYMNIADQLEEHAKQELQHALIISRQIDYLGAMPTVTPKPVKISDKPRDMLRFDLDNENETVRAYRERIRQCEALGEFARPSRFARSWCRSRITRSISPPRSARTFPT